MLNADEIESAWIADVSCVGVTAGASTPEFLVEQVVEHLLERGGEGSEVQKLGEIEEHIAFKLPPEIRDEGEAKRA